MMRVSSNDSSKDLAMHVELCQEVDNTAEHKEPNKIWNNSDDLLEALRNPIEPADLSTNNFRGDDV